MATRETRRRQPRQECRFLIVYCYKFIIVNKLHLVTPRERSAGEWMGEGVMGESGDG